jgi:hypothetical protein
MNRYELFFELGPVGTLLLAVIFLIVKHKPHLCYNKTFKCELFVYRYILPKNNWLNKLLPKKHTYKGPRIALLVYSYAFAILLTVVLLVMAILAGTTAEKEFIQVGFAILCVAALVLFVPEMIMDKKAEACWHEQGQMTPEQIERIKDKIKEDYPDYFN